MNFVTYMELPAGHMQPPMAGSKEAGFEDTTGRVRSGDK
jgi:hypothetical protein